MYDSENEAAKFPRFIALETLVGICQAKLYPFLIEKVISSRTTRNGNLLVEVDSQKHAENIFKIKILHTMKCFAHPKESD